MLNFEPDYYKCTFAEMVFIKKYEDNCLKRTTDLEFFNESYSMISDL